MSYFIIFVYPDKRLQSITNSTSPQRLPEVSFIENFQIVLFKNRQYQLAVNFFYRTKLSNHEWSHENIYTISKKKKLFFQYASYIIFYVHVHPATCGSKTCTRRAVCTHCRMCIVVSTIDRSTGKIVSGTFMYVYT